ncbi:MAG: hypothetical protein GXY44_14000 [Phycisphaerales bacterium]|nr:hypothetical protein [Phycisphaerales bacterium]
MQHQQRPGRAFRGSYSPRPGLLLRLPALTTDTPDGRVVFATANLAGSDGPEHGTTCGVRWQRHRFGYSTNAKIRANSPGGKSGVTAAALHNFA